MSKVWPPDSIGRTKSEHYRGFAQSSISTWLSHPVSLSLAFSNKLLFFFTTATRFENKVKYNFCTDCHFTAGKAGSDNQRIQLIVATAQIRTACSSSVNCMAPAQESE